MQIPKDHIHSSPDALFVQSFDKQPQIVQCFNGSGWIFDLALDGAVKTGNQPLPGGRWRLSFHTSARRIIEWEGGATTVFVSLQIVETMYNSLNLNEERTTGKFDSCMAYPLLQIINALVSREPDACSMMHHYVQLLLQQTTLSNVTDSYVPFADLQNVDAIIQGLGEVPSVLLPLASLIRQSGLSASAFQKACRALYGMSAKKILHHRKMSRGYRAMVFERMPIDVTGSMLGYAHTPNFITAFRKHFDVTPFEVFV